MISCKLQGGIGNQLFQIATAHALALRNNDISGFDIMSCYTPLQGNTSIKYRYNILSKINVINGYNFNNIYNEPKYSYSEINYSKDLILNGYFQSEKYFSDYKEQIIDLFQHHVFDMVKNQVSVFHNKNKPITTVHVRRGDYLINPEFHPVCPIEYYKKAINEIGDSNFIFFSDDMAWVKENFIGDNIYYSPFDDEISDLMFMSSATNNIIANSSFSWWGAYLNNNPTKKVIAPKNWFGIKGPKDTQDLIPNTWLII